MRALLTGAAGFICQHAATVPRSLLGREALPGSDLAARIRRQP